jgi:hypothetical protein
VRPHHRRLEAAAAATDAQGAVVTSDALRGAARCLTRHSPGSVVCAGVARRTNSGNRATQLRHAWQGLPRLRVDPSRHGLCIRRHSLLPPPLVHGMLRYTAATSRNKSLESSSVSQAPPLFDASCFLRRLHRSNKAEVLMWVSYRATEKRNVCDAILPDALAIDTVTL